MSCYVILYYSSFSLLCCWGLGQRISHLVKALWGKLWFVNVGYTNTIRLIYWLYYIIFYVMQGSSHKVAADNMERECGCSGSNWSPISSEFITWNRQSSGSSSKHFESSGWLSSVHWLWCASKVILVCLKKFTDKYVWDFSRFSIITSFLYLTS